MYCRKYGQLELDTKNRTWRALHILNGVLLRIELFGPNEAHFLCYSKPWTANNSEFWTSWDKTECDGTRCTYVSQSEQHIPKPSGCFWQGLELYTLLLESFQYRKGEHSFVFITGFKLQILDFISSPSQTSKQVVDRAVLWSRKQTAVSVLPVTSSCFALARLGNPDSQPRGRTSHL